MIGLENCECDGLQSRNTQIGADLHPARPVGEVAEREAVEWAWPSAVTPLSFCHAPYWFVWGITSEKVYTSDLLNGVCELIPPPRLLKDPAHRAELVRSIVANVQREHADGANVDIEAPPDGTSSHRRYCRGYLDAPRYTLYGETKMKYDKMH